MQKTRYTSRRPAMGRHSSASTVLIAAAIVATGALVIWRFAGGTSNRPGAASAAEVAAVATTPFPSTDGSLSLAGEQGSKLVVFFYDGAT